MKIFFPKELDSEKRISITPDFLKKYLDSGLKVSVQTSIGLHLGFKDEIYKEFKKIADEVNGKFDVNYSDEIPNVAIFVSKQNHCLIDLLWRVRN